MTGRSLEYFECTGEITSSVHLPGTSGTHLEPSGHRNLGAVRDRSFWNLSMHGTESQYPVALTQMRAEVRPQFMAREILLDPAGHRKPGGVWDRILVVSASGRI